MLTFTVPESLPRSYESTQRLGYEALFEASSQAMKALVHNPRFLGRSTPSSHRHPSPRYPPAAEAFLF